MTDLSDVSQVPVAVARRVDQFCDQLETAWKAAAGAEQRFSGPPAAASLQSQNTTEGPRHVGSSSVPAQ